MSMIDDARVLLQDVVAPDLKAISARLDALEHTATQRFDANDKANDRRFETADKTMKQGFESVSQRFIDLKKSILQRFDSIEKLSDVRHELLILRIDSGTASADAKFDTILKALNIDRRMEQLEAIVAAQGKGSQQEERQAKSA
jgi:hypothetical protein